MKKGIVIFCVFFYSFQTFAEQQAENVIEKNEQVVEQQIKEYNKVVVDDSLRNERNRPQNNNQSQRPSLDKGKQEHQKAKESKDKTQLEKYQQEHNLTIKIPKQSSLDGRNGPPPAPKHADKPKQIWHSSQKNLQKEKP